MLDWTSRPLPAFGCNIVSYRIVSSNCTWSADATDQPRAHPWSINQSINQS